MRCVIGAGQICILIFMFAQPVSACELRADSTWFWNDQQLITKVRVVWRVRAIDEVYNKDSGTSDYRFKVLEAIADPGLALERPAELHFSQLRPSQFELKKDQRLGLVTYTKACKAWAKFQLQKEYLVFPSLTNPGELLLHPKAALGLPGGAKDSWVETVRRVKSEMQLPK